MTDNGGNQSAFPSRSWDRGGEHVTTSLGINQRDYFAAKALQGMLASDSSVDRTKVNKGVWARVAYEFADAMLEARMR